MAEKREAGIANILLVWIIGLALGVAAGAATAMLLIPMHGNAAENPDRRPALANATSHNTEHQIQAVSRGI